MRYKEIFKHYDFATAVLIFGIVLFLKIDFYKAVILLLELIVIIEVVQMIVVFLRKQRVKLRFMVDASIIFTIREILIAVTDKNTAFERIYMLLFVVLVFFLFRLFALKITHSSFTKKQRTL
ncbi:phosphate-starvation-inducible PsiE family protein [Nitrosophilus alvini]|uniref:phosphate-starvation-inducible PsiE family protein n=1 Tax=Nitrosophilus alvini TaxID=2714855 RepID=UPI00190B2EF3|nr:phosphate-starvation-inducible PsiE family protein [Nitrosophilus alvini]